MIRSVNAIEHLTEKQWKNTKSNDENLLKRVKVLNKQKQLNDGLSDLYTGLLHNRKGQIEMAISTLLGKKPSINLDKKYNQYQINPNKNSKIIKTEHNKKNEYWVKPLNGKITSYYGYRNQPTVGASSNHSGIDIKAQVGTPVMSIEDGKVIATGTNMRGYGTGVFINHGKINGKYVRSEYGHLNSYCVKNGQYVKKGQIIGYSGNTGISTGPHLHLTIRESLDGKTYNHVNPQKYIKF